MSIDSVQFSAGEVAKAADITPSTLQNWIKRDVIIGHRKIEGGGSQGKHRRFSFFNVMEIATAAALVKVGVTDLGIAFLAAQIFAHTGHGIDPDNLERNPSMPYDIDHGRTLLIISGDHPVITPYKPGTDPFNEYFFLRRPEAFIVVDLLCLFDRVCDSLGLHPQEVMDQAYSKAEG